MTILTISLGPSSIEVIKGYNLIQLSDTLYKYLRARPGDNIGNQRNEPHQ